MAKEYIEPSWSGKPPKENHFHLDVLKNGVIVENIQLVGEKSFFLLGRQADIVDILAEHPSVSRQHAVFQFRDDGALMCLDLGSAQGTFVNKSLCSSGVYQRLYVGDIVRFGVSTRSYVVNGPESQMLPEYDSENLQNYRKKLKTRSEEAEKAKIEKEAAGITWGFSEDAPTEAFDDEDTNDEAELPSYIKDDKNFSRKFGEKYSAEIKDNEVNEKDKALLERLRAKEQKIKNMQEENRRIYMKESSQESGLTEGQSAAVSRNDARIEVLKEEIETLIEEIRTKKVQRDGGKISSKIAKVDRAKPSGAERDDDLLDTTAETADATTNWRLRRKLAKNNQNLKSLQSISSSSSLSYEELFSAKQAQEAKIEAIRAKIAEEESREAAVVTKNGSGQKTEGGDGDGDIEGLLASEGAREAAANLRRLRASESEAAADLGKISRLVKAATPALLSLASRPAATATAPAVLPVSSPPCSSNGGQTMAREAPIVTAALLLKDGGTGGISVSGGAGASAGQGGPHMQEADDPQLIEAAHLGEKSGEVYSSEKLLGVASATTHEGEARIDSLQAVEEEKKSNERPGHKRQRAEKEGYSSLSAIVKSNRIDNAAREEEQNDKPFDSRSSNSSSSSSSGSSSRGSLNGDHAGSSTSGKGGEDSTDSVASRVMGADIELAATSSSAQSVSSRKRVVGPQRPAAAHSEDALTSLDPHTLQGGEKVWVPPKNQTGDGRTALNIRLGY